ncbi:Imm31 family immunity protein [Pararhodonellum marinum]|uniref:Imm31 family immunity protein n=1 Tax=Pararhodonellum marinum TaxID=2755358 RepID=UPI00188E207C|nr:Imm31 family immunity protein [Pararhodonellum marinum]
MTPPFDFYEIVVIKSNVLTRKHKISGMRSCILGKASDNYENWFYTVWLFENEKSWDLPSTCLEKTGDFMKREDFYDGTIIKVKVDPESGEGEIMNPNLL